MWLRTFRFVNAQNEAACRGLVLTSLKRERLSFPPLMRDHEKQSPENQ